MLCHTWKGLKLNTRESSPGPMSYIRWLRYLKLWIIMNARVRTWTQLCLYAIIYLLFLLMWSVADSCLENPCFNGGTCVESESVKCICLPGYQGDWCQRGMASNTPSPWTFIINPRSVNPFLLHVCVRPGGLWTGLGEVPGLLLPSLYKEAELGGGWAALQDEQWSPDFCHDPRRTGLHQR